MTLFRFFKRFLIRSWNKSEIVNWLIQLLNTGWIRKYYRIIYSHQIISPSLLTDHFIFNFKTIVSTWWKYCSQMNVNTFWNNNLRKKQVLMPNKLCDHSIEENQVRKKRHIKKIPWNLSCLWKNLPCVQAISSVNDVVTVFHGCHS